MKIWKDIYESGYMGRACCYLEKFIKAPVEMFMIFRYGGFLFGSEY